VTNGDKQALALTNLLSQDPLSKDHRGDKCLIEFLKGYNMTNSKILPGSFLAAAALLSGLTVATAQTTQEAAPVQAEVVTDGPDAKPHGMRKRHGGRGARGMMGAIMKKADANGDRAVTQEEIDTYRAGLVSGADVSGDGNLSLAEFETIYAQMIRERMVDVFQKLDADGDGQVTQAEMDKRFGNIVERMDRNQDGQLDRDDRAKRGHGKMRGDDDGKRQGDRDGKKHRDHDRKPTE